MTEQETTPRVDHFMTPTPATVHSGLRLVDALDRMYSDNVRHLPVVNDDGALVGIISTRDAAVMASLRGGGPETTLVQTAMMPAPYSCARGADLLGVIEHMEEHRIGSVVVVEDGKPIGVFTTTDALRALRTMIVGGPVTPLVRPRHLVDSDEAGTDGHDLRHTSTSRSQSRSAGMLSWCIF